MAGPEGEECFRLGEGMEVTEVIELELGVAATQEGAETGDPVVNLTMLDADGAAFADLTTEAAATASMRVAMVVDGEVVSAPQVAQENSGGQVQIASWHDAEEFVTEGTGG